MVGRKNGEGATAGEDEEVEEEEDEIREEDVRELYDDETQVCEMPEAPDPRLFVEGLTLRRYQRQALAWMINREKKRYVTEEDCTGLSMGGGGGGVTEVGPAEVDDKTPGAAESNGSCSSGSAEGNVSIRDGCVYVASWGRRSARGGAAGGAGGGGGGTEVAMHPLWERRAAASIAVRATTKAAAAAAPASGGLFDLPGAIFDDDFGVGLVPRSGTAETSAATAAAAGEQLSPLSHPEAFYVNVYSRRFQREFPPASLGCRGGILADEMGMGKVTDCCVCVYRGRGGGGRGERGERGKRCFCAVWSALHVEGGRVCSVFLYSGVYFFGRVREGNVYVCVGWPRRRTLS